MPTPASSTQKTPLEEGYDRLHGKVDAIKRQLILIEVGAAIALLALFVIALSR